MRQLISPKALTTAIAAGFASTAAKAQVTVEGLDSIGKPEPSGTGFQAQATSLMRDIVWLDTFLLVIITIISLFVLALLAYVIVRYNERSNPTPAGAAPTQPSSNGLRR